MTSSHPQHPHSGVGVNRQIPVLSGGNGFTDRGLQRATDLPRSEFINQWFCLLQARLRDVRVTCGDWGRVVTDSVTVRHGVTAVFLDPPYSKGEMDYAAGGVGTDLPIKVQEWCATNGSKSKLRIVLCGHAGEHDALLQAGWFIAEWTARKGYAATDEALANSASETLWCSPHCLRNLPAKNFDLFAETA